MIIIESAKNGHRWISGIYLDNDFGRQRMAAIENDDGALHKAVEVSMTYPLYLVEDDAGFHAMTQSDLHRYLRMFDTSATGRAPDEPVCNIFTISKDYEPGTLGCDEMGYLPHSHIMPEEMSANGIDSLIAQYTR